MNNVTPIRPELPPAPPPERSLKLRIDAECRRIYQVRAVTELAERSINSFSGDEDSLEIVSDLSTHTLALEAARHILGEVLGKLEIMAHEVDQEAQAA